MAFRASGPVSVSAARRRLTAGAARAPQGRRGRGVGPRKRRAWRRPPSDRHDLATGTTSTSRGRLNYYPKLMASEDFAPYGDTATLPASEDAWAAVPTAIDSLIALAPVDEDEAAFSQLEGGAM